MKIILIMLGVIFNCINIIAQQPQIGLDEAIKIALQNNREIEIAKLDVDKANAAVSEAFGYALPSLDVSAGFSHFVQKPQMAFPDFGAMLNNFTYSILFDEGVLPEDDSKFMSMEPKLQSFALANNYQAQAQVTQILFNSAIFRGIGASHIYLDLAKENLKRTIAKTVLDVKKAYYGVLLTKELHDIAEARFTNANDHHKNIKQMLDHGLVSEFAELSAAVQVENIRPILVQLENAYIDATNGLKILLDINQSDEIEITGIMEYQAEDLPLEADLISRAKESNLALNTLKLKHQLDEEFAAISRGNYWPTIAAFGNFTYAGSGEEWVFQDYTSTSVGLNFTINLFQGGRTENKVEQDMIVSLQTAEQIKGLTDATEMQVKSKLNELKRVKQQIEAMDNNVSLAQRAYEIADSRYKEGEGSQLEVKDADVSLSNAKINYTNAVHDYIIAKASLYNLVGLIDSKYYELASKYFEKNRR